MFEKFLDAMGFNEVTEEVIVDESQTQEDTSNWKNRKTRAQVVPFNSNKEQVKVALLEPENFDDCQQIADSLKNKRTVIINLESLDTNLARRIIDFVGGATYALGGSIQKIGSGIIIALPNNVDISGEINNITQPKEVMEWIDKISQTPDLRRY